MREGAEQGSIDSDIITLSNTALAHFSESAPGLLTRNIAH